VALSRAGLVEEGVSRMVEIGVDILFSLTTLEMENQSSHLEQLIGQLEDWLADETEEITGTEETKYLLWPFEAARRLSEVTGDPSKLDPEQIEKVARREIDRLIPNDK